MSNHVPPNNSDPAGRLPENGPETVEALQREVEQLRAQLEKVRAESEEHRRSVYALLDHLIPYTPPTEEEVHELLHGPQGQPLIEIIEEYERKAGG